MLIFHQSGPPILGLEVPVQLHWVLREPAPLAGMKLPSAAWPWSELHAGGFVDLVSLHPSPYDPAPLQKIFGEHLEDLVGGGPPRDPERETKLVREAVDVTMQSLRSGRGVVVHCWGGRGRTGTVLGCVLRELGYEPDEVIDSLNQIHIERGTPGWPESRWQEHVVRHWSAAG